MKIVDYFSDVEESEISNEPEIQNNFDKFHKQVSNTPKISKRTIVLLLILFVLVLSIVILFVALSTKNNTAPADSLPSEITNPYSNTQIISSTSQSVSSQSVAAVTPPESAPIPKDEWFMRLVNVQNPLEEDFNVETKTIAGGYHFDARAIEHLQNLLNAADAAGIKLKVVSASRSFEYQETLFKNKVSELRRGGMTREEAEQQASKVTGRPYECEHNLALAADISAADNLKLRSDFDQTPEFAWLKENAQNFGFIMRYPQDKEEITMAQYEPWHWRYVGEEQAKLIKESGLCLEEYLVG